MAHTIKHSYRLFAHWASALINGDYSGYSDEEAGEIQQFLSTAKGAPVDTEEEEAFFAHSNDASPLGGDCFNYIFVEHKKLFAATVICYSDYMGTYFYYADTAEQVQEALEKKLEEQYDGSLRSADITVAEVDEGAIEVI